MEIAVVAFALSFVIGFIVCTICSTIKHKYDRLKEIRRMEIEHIERTLGLINGDTEIIDNVPPVTGLSQDDYMANVQQLHNKIMERRMRDFVGF